MVFAEKIQTVECTGCGDLVEVTDTKPGFVCSRCDTIFDNLEEAEACCPDAPTGEPE